MFFPEDDLMLRSELTIGRRRFGTAPQIPFEILPGASLRQVEVSRCSPELV